MLLYISSPAFIGRTFVISCVSSDTIARLKANILHILYEMGRGSHQFRLKFKGQFLKDSSTIEEYGIADSHVVKMIPLSTKSFTSNPLISSTSTINERVTEDRIESSLNKEVGKLKLRERLCNDMQVCLWVLFGFGVVHFVTHHWFTAIYKCLFAAAGIYLAPKYSRLSGFYFKSSESNDAVVIFLAIVSSLLCVGNVVQLLLLHFLECDFITNFPNCPKVLYFTVVVYFVETFVLLGMAIFSAILQHNFKFKIGNFIEPVLVEIRAINHIFSAAKSNSTKEKRAAALDLANMAASSVDNKFSLVAEGGLQVLIDLALTDDEGTKGYAIEAIAELLTLKSIQNQFVLMGGVNTLMAALYSTDQHVVKESILGLCQLSQDNEEHTAVILGDSGMDDLCHVVHRCGLDCVRLVAGIFLDVSFSPELRGELVKHKKYISAFERLIKIPDSTCQQLGLQTLELLALNSPHLILSHPSLISPLINAVCVSADNSVQTLSAKLLLYFVLNDETLYTVVNSPQLKNCIYKLVHGNDNIQQNVAGKMMYQLLEEEKSSEILNEEYIDIVHWLRANALDQEAWMLSDKIIIAFQDER